MIAEDGDDVAEIKAKSSQKREKRTMTVTLLEKKSILIRMFYYVKYF
jgi:hypothetical protein